MPELDEDIFVRIATYFYMTIVAAMGIAAIIILVKLVLSAY